MADILVVDQMIVYLATNKINGKRYIGCTSKSLRRRMHQHLADAAGHRGGCRIFYAAIRKYGPDAFEWRKISDHLTRTEMLSAERSEIAKFKPEYNISAGGQGTNSVPWTEDRKKQMSAFMKGRKMTPEARQKWRDSYAEGGIRNPIICLNDGLTFKNASEAASHYGIAYNSVSRSARLSVRCDGKYFVKFTQVIEPHQREAMIAASKKLEHDNRRASKLGKCFHTAESKRKISEAHKGNQRRLGSIHTDEVKEILRISGHKNIDIFRKYTALGPQAQSKRVVCISDGSMFPSASAAANNYGLAKSAVIELCNGSRGRKTVGGMVFKYAESEAA